MCFSYFLPIKPVTPPTEDILDLTDVTYEWHQFSGKGNGFEVGLLWLPVVIIYLTDTQIWYPVSPQIATKIGLYHVGFQSFYTSTRSLVPSLQDLAIHTFHITFLINGISGNLFSAPWSQNRFIVYLNHWTRTFRGGLSFQATSAPPPCSAWVAATPPCPQPPTPGLSLTITAYSNLQ